MKYSSWDKDTQAAVIVALSILALILLAQNTHVVAVRFLFWHISMSLIVLIFLCLLLGFTLGTLFKKR
jgi:uncharacterized integral membrane protein